MLSQSMGERAPAQWTLSQDLDSRIHLYRRYAISEVILSGPCYELDVRTAVLNVQNRAF